MYTHCNSDCCTFLYDLLVCFFSGRFTKCSIRGIKERNTRATEGKTWVLPGASEERQTNQTPGDGGQADENQAPGGAA